MLFYFNNYILLIIALFLSSCSIFNAGTVHLKYSDGEAEIEGNKYELKKKLGKPAKFYSFALLATQQALLRALKHFKCSYN